MKIAIIKPFKLDEVRKALIGVQQQKRKAKWIPQRMANALTDCKWAIS